MAALAVGAVAVHVARAEREKTFAGADAHVLTLGVVVPPNALALLVHGTLLPPPTRLNEQGEIIMKKSLKAGLAALAIAGYAVPGSAQAAPAIGCGTVLTSNTTLTADVTGCTGDGLVIGASGIVVDLAGHTVAGDGVPSANGLDVGIRDTGFAGVTVTGGAVSGFDRGVWLTNAGDSVVSQMAVHGQANRGITIQSSDASHVVANTAFDNGGSGVAIVDSNAVEVARNRNHGNPTGVRLQGSTATLVNGNDLHANENAVQVVDGADGNTISGNRLDEATGAAVEMQFSNNNTITHNVSRGTNDGITLEASNDNVITDNEQLSAIGPDGIGIQIYGNRNLVARNTVVGFIRFGIEVDDFQDPGHSPAADNVIRDNVVKNGVEGIAIGPEAGGVVLGTLLLHNTVSGASDDGIQALGPSTGLETSTVTNNIATHNGNYGIAVVPGTIDGGGNVAHGNGNPSQCLGISCR